MGILEPLPDVISDLRHYLASSDEYDESNNRKPGVMLQFRRTIRISSWKINS